MQLDAERAGQGAGMCTGETIKKEGVSGQLGHLVANSGHTQFKVGILTWTSDKSNK